MSRRWQIGLGLVLALVAVNVGLRGLQSLTGGTPGGPAGSSYATGASGAAAWARLLAREGHEVRQLRRAPSASRLSPGETAVVLEPGFVVRRDAAVLGRFVRAGGRLVAGGGDLAWLRGIVPGGAAVPSRGLRSARPLAPVPEVAGVAVVRAAGVGAWSTVHAALPILGDRSRTLAAVAAVGRGRVVALADGSPVTNAFLARADNARFALDIAGAPSRPVVFLETYHGYGSSSGLGAVPWRWRALLGLGLLAVGVFVLARARRLGPPELGARELDPPRLEYVDALAGALARTHSPTLALGPLKEEVRRRVARAGTPPGFASDEAEAVARDTVRGEDVLPLGRALARLAGARRSDRWA